MKMCLITRTLLTGLEEKQLIRVIRIPKREAIYLRSRYKVFRIYPFTNVENKLRANGPNNLYDLFHIH